MKKLILLSSALLGVVFLAGCGQQPARQTQSTTPAPIAEQPAVWLTAGWKTYTSDKYGFSFQYPSDWELSENSGNNSGRSVATIVNPETRKLAQNKQVLFAEDISIYYHPSISDEPENALNKLGATTLEEFIKKNTSITKIGSTELGNIQATDVLWAGMGSSYVILATNNSHLYEILFSNINSKDNLTSIEKTIISTFKFTSATPADWKTYKSDKYGFEFQYWGVVVSSGSNENSITLSDEESGHWLYNIDIGNNSGNLTLDKIMAKEEANFNKTHAGSIENVDYNRTVSDIVIGGKPAKRYSIKKLGDYGNAGAFLIIGNNILTIIGDDSSASGKTAFDALLSTFKFTK